MEVTESLLRIVERTTDVMHTGGLMDTLLTSDIPAQWKRTWQGFAAGIGGPTRDSGFPDPDFAIAALELLKGNFESSDTRCSIASVVFQQNHQVIIWDEEPFRSVMETRGRCGRGSRTSTARDSGQ